MNVKYAATHVPKSPFRVRAGPPFDANKVKVTGKGVDEEPLAGEPVEFLCDCSKAGNAPLAGRFIFLSFPIAFLSVFYFLDPFILSQYSCL